MSLLSSRPQGSFVRCSSVVPPAARCLGSRTVHPQRVVGVHLIGLEGSRFLPGVSLLSSKSPVGNTCRSRFRTMATWIPPSSQIASSAFTWGTVAVLPFYTLMVVAPNASITKRTMESGIPYIVLGALYAYLLYLSWTPDTLRYMFASAYWLPELPGIAQMFSNEMTLASAWIHLLTVDLFAARQVYKDGLKNEIETRHSVSLCLLFCPVGILTHVITKLLAKMVRPTEHPH